MTSTLTRPPAVASGDDVTTSSATPPAGTWLTTGDHKRLGLLFVYGAVLSLVAASVAGAILLLRAESPNVWTQPGSRLAAITTTAALVVGIPALWIGLATYITPLQIGATRLALPRLHSLALWTFGVGSTLAAVGYLAEPDGLTSLASSAPAAAQGAASDGTELAIVGLMLVVAATFLAALSLLVTVLNRRASGLRLTFLPLFSWSTLATSTVLVVASPVLLAGLVLLFFEHHYGGELLASGIGGMRIWQHELWLLGQPFGLLFAAAAVGLFGDIVATHSGRPLVGFPVARAAAAAAPLLTLVLWTGRTSTLESPFAPVATIGALVVGLPLGLALLTWLGTLKGGKPKAHASLLFLAAFLALVGLATALSVAAVFVGVEGPDAEAFRNGQISLLMFGAPLLALGAAGAHWSPKLWGRVTPIGQASVQALLLLVGAVLLSLPGYFIGLGGGDGVVPLGIAGSIAVALGVLMFGLDIASRGATSEANPYRGQTLEWATASPPPVHNFDEIPDIRSAHPLLSNDGDDTSGAAG